VIAALRAHAAAVELEPLSAEVGTDPAPLAPDFSFATDTGVPSTLRELLARGTVLLIFGDIASSPLAAQIERWRDALSTQGAAVLNLPHDPEIRSVYAFYDPGHPRRTESPPETVAFLIDRDGYIRASWHPGDKPDWRDQKTLTAQIAAMDRLKLAPVTAGGHVH